jgi:hypothetical protein
MKAAGFNVTTGEYIPPQNWICFAILLCSTNGCRLVEEEFFLCIISTRY